MNAAIFFVESQTLDLVVMGKRGMLDMKHRLESMLTESAMTLAQAISKVLTSGQLGRHAATVGQLQRQAS